MSDRTGLGPLEVALLEATAAVQAGSEEPVRTTDVLDECERSAGYGPSYAFPVLQDLGAWWRTHLNLFDVHGNLGTVEGDPPADAKYTEVRLSPPAGWRSEPREASSGRCPSGSSTAPSTGVGSSLHSHRGARSSCCIGWSTRRMSQAGASPTWSRSPRAAPCTETSTACTPATAPGCSSAAGSSVRPRPAW